MRDLENNFNSLNFDNQDVLYKKPSYHNMQSQENNLSSQQKMDKQKVYRDYLSMQVINKACYFR